MSTRRPHRITLFFEAGTGWTVCRRGQLMTLRKFMRNLTSELIHIDPVRLPDWTLRDSPILKGIWSGVGVSEFRTRSIRCICSI